MRIGPFGLPEIAILILVLLLVFGAKRLPEVGASLGKGIRSFKSGLLNEEEEDKEDVK